MTGQVLARQRLEEAQATMRGAIELAELGTWHINVATGILEYSERLRYWFGIDPNEVITIERAYHAIREADRPLIQASMQHALTPGTNGIYDVEYTVEAAATGRERIIHAQGKAFYKDDGTVYKVSGTAQDVTAQRTVQLALEQEVQERTEELQVLNEELSATNEDLHETNEQLTHSNEELAQYAYVASHDLQEPLRKIRMFSGMLEEQENLTEESRRLVSKIVQSSGRMSLLIRDLLDFSRLLKSDSLMRPVDLVQVMTEVTGDFELTIEEKKAEIKIGTLPVVEGVALQMNQLLYNLLSNALKFTRDDLPPVITIDSHPMAFDDAKKGVVTPRPYSNYYHITFTDNGIGFDAQYAEQIFEVFKRLHGRDIYPGSGIGLALCRRIVSNHSGYMYVESEVGKGTTFHIILPDRSNNYQTMIPEGDTRTEQ
jgi:PAS domain S-box-containing protein